MYSIILHDTVDVNYTGLVYTVKFVCILDELLSIFYNNITFISYMLVKCMSRYYNYITYITFVCLMNYSIFSTIVLHLQLLYADILDELYYINNFLFFVIFCLYSAIILKL